MKKCVSFYFFGLSPGLSASVTFQMSTTPVAQFLVNSEFTHNSFALIVAENNLAL